MSTYNRNQRLKSKGSEIATNDKVVQATSIVLLLAVWWFAANVLGLKDLTSSPLIVLTATYELAVSLEWIEHFIGTMRRILYAFVFTMFLGATVGIAMGVSDFWEKFLQDYVTIGLSMPTLFAVIFATMWFGVSDLTPMVATGILTFGFTSLIMYEGVNDIDTRLIDMSRSFGISRRRMIRRVFVGALAGELFAAARYAFAVSWKIAVFAEFFAAQNGIGFMIQEQMDSLSLVGVLKWSMLFIVVMVFLEYIVFQKVEDYVFEWREDTNLAAW